MKLHQQGNKIIVTKLMPMSEVPPGEFVLCLIERSKRFESLIKVLWKVSKILQVCADRAQRYYK